MLVINMTMLVFEPTDKGSEGWSWKNELKHAYWESLKKFLITLCKQIYI